MSTVTVFGWNVLVPEFGLRHNTPAAFRSQEQYERACADPEFKATIPLSDQDERVQGIVDVIRANPGIWCLQEVWPQLQHGLTSDETLVNYAPHSWTTSVVHGCAVVVVGDARGLVRKASRVYDLSAHDEYRSAVEVTIHQGTCERTILSAHLTGYDRAQPEAPKAAFGDVQLISLLQANPPCTNAHSIIVTDANEDPQVIPTRKIPYHYQPYIEARAGGGPRVSRRDIAKSYGYVYTPATPGECIDGVFAVEPHATSVLPTPLWGDHKDRPLSDHAPFRFQI